MGWNLSWQLCGNERLGSRDWSTQGQTPRSGPPSTKTRRAANRHRASRDQELPPRRKRYAAKRLLVQINLS